MDIQVIVNQMIILFLVMIIGYIANKSGILDQTQNQKMSSLVLNITSPGLILSSVRAPTNGSLSSVIQIFLISIAIYMVLPIMGILLSRILKVPKEDRNLYQFMTIFSNIGFMGYPVIQSIFGDEALFFASICNLVFNLVCYSYGVYLISGSGKLSFDFKQLINPGIIFSIIAVIIYLTKYQMPQIIGETSDLIGSITTPVAIMGCVVNGPGEAREADIGIAGGKGQGILFKKGKLQKRKISLCIYGGLSTFFIYGFLIIRNKFLHNFSNITGITDLFCQNHLHGTDTRMIQSHTVSLPVNNLYSVKILSVQHMRNLL